MGAAPGGGLARPRTGLPGEVSRERSWPGPPHRGPFNHSFVGNLIPRKELHTLLAALASLPRMIGGDRWPVVWRWIRLMLRPYAARSRTPA